MTQRISPERVADLLECDILANSAMTGPLLERYQLITAEPYLGNVLLSLSRWAYKLSPNGEMTLNEIIIAALDAIKGEK